MTPIATSPDVHPDLQRLAVGLLSAPAAFSSPRSFELVFDDVLPVTVHLHPDGRSIAVDLWCGDAQGIADAPRRVLIELLLGLNARDPGDPTLWVGLDSRDFILLHGRLPLQELDSDGLAAGLRVLVDEALDIQSLVDLLLP